VIRVVLADDHKMVRAGLRRLLSDFPDLAVVDEVTTGDQLLERVGRQDVDVAVADVSMPGPGIIELIRGMRAAAPRVRVIVLSMHPEEQYAVRVLRAGASGYLNKEEPGEQLAEAIRNAHAGRRYVSAALAQTLAASLDRERTASVEDLSDRELEVLRLMGAGKSGKQIAALLRVSPKTVSTYRARLLEKLNLHTTADLIRFALERGLSG
jgi:DNA-binding NarL/FixJ family response regulator